MKRFYPWLIFCLPLTYSALHGWLPIFFGDFYFFQCCRQYNMVELSYEYQYITTCRRLIICWYISFFCEEVNVQKISHATILIEFCKILCKKLRPLWGNAWFWVLCSSLSFKGTWVTYVALPDGVRSFVVWESYWPLLTVEKNNFSVLLSKINLFKCLQI